MFFDTFQHVAPPTIYVYTGLKFIRLCTSFECVLEGCVPSFSMFGVPAVCDFYETNQTIMKSS